MSSCRIGSYEGFLRFWNCLSFYKKYYLLQAPHFSLFSLLCSLNQKRYSLFTIPCSLQAKHFSLFSLLCSLTKKHYSLFTIPCSLPQTHSCGKKSANSYSSLARRQCLVQCSSVWTWLARTYFSTFSAKAST